MSQPVWARSALAFHRSMIHRALAADCLEQDCPHPLAGRVTMPAAFPTILEA